jgi:hypothetical protein
MRVDFPMSRLLVTLLFLLVLSGECLAQQRVLMLQKRNKNKTVYYKPGDRIAFRLEGSKEKVSGQITEIKDDFIVLSGAEFPVRDITSLYVDGKTKWWLRFKVEQIALVAGIGYMTLELINTGGVSRDVLITSGIFIGVGVLAHVLIGNRIKIKGRTRLRIVKIM